ncbi:MAG: hypothetical protein J5796_01860 [Erysipelotrichaceae bacterium]|nr:hypothetical protein [Erysipelotrichaceae bacterium]
MSRNNNLLEYVADLYYNRGLSQQEIGAIIGSSRPTVSRLIEDARKQGIVKIIIETSVTKNTKLSNRLRKSFGLKDAVVVKADFDFDKSIELCGKAVASILPVYLQPGMSLGISWGRSINSVIDALEDDVLDGIDVCQMVGCMTMGNPSVDGFSAAQRMAKKTHGNFYSINTPLFIEGVEVYNYLINEPLINEALIRSCNVDVCINGVGSAADPKNSVAQSGYYDYYLLNRFADKGAVASFVGTYIDIDGNRVDVDDIYLIATPLDIVRKIPVSIVLSASAENADAVMAVLNGGYADILVVDEPLANRLLELKK